MKLSSSGRIIAVCGIIANLSLPFIFQTRGTQEHLLFFSLLTDFILLIIGLWAQHELHKKIPLKIIFIPIAAIISDMGGILLIQNPTTEMYGALLFYMSSITLITFLLITCSKLAKKGL